VPVSRLSAQSTTTETEAAAATAAGAEAGAGSSGTFAGGAFYVVNRQAGMLSVSGSQRQHELLTAYLEQIKASASAQVLIEAKIVEVSLKDEYRTGIDWSTLANSADRNGIDFSFAPTFPNAANIATARIGIDDFGINMDAAVQLAEQFGTTRTLSSPRLHAINNQPAVLTFAENRVFFEVTVEREDDQVVGLTTIPGSISVESTRRSVPIGIILNILPSVDAKRNEVTLNVRPTLSRQVGTVTDPGSALVNQLILNDSGGNTPAFTNEVPIVEVRELDSIMKIRSGQVMVIGGLMEQSSTNTDRGTPFIDEVPFLGNLFKSVEKTDNTKELVIFIRATIVTPHGSYDDADRRVYEKFTNDPRPINF
jgi:general secretion pathway protein D